MENTLSLVLSHRIPLFFIVDGLLGEVIEGMDLVKKIESLGSDSGKVNKKVTIASSGVV